MLHYFNIVLLTLHYTNVLIFDDVILLDIGPFNVHYWVLYFFLFICLMLHYFNVTIFYVALSDVTLFIVASFTVRYLILTMQMLHSVLLFDVVLFHIIVLFDVSLS